MQLGHVCDAFGITHPGRHAPALPCRSAKAQRLVLAAPARGHGKSTGAERASHDAVGACCDSRLTPLTTTSAHRATLGAHAPRFHGYHAAWANKKKRRSESRKNAGSIGLRYIPASGFTSDLMPPMQAVRRMWPLLPFFAIASVPLMQMLCQVRVLLILDQDSAQC